MIRAATLTISILSLTALGLGCEKKSTTPPDDAAGTAGDAEAEGGDAEASEESKPKEDAGGGW